MKKIIFLLNVVLILYLFDDLQAQHVDLKISYSIFYEYPSADSIKLGKKIAELWQKLDGQSAMLASEMETILYCNMSTSSFVLKDKLTVETQNMAQRIVELATMQPGGSYYVDLREKKRIELLQRDGEWYRIQLPDENYRWKITNQSKKILDHTCFKAIADTVIIYSTFRKKTTKIIPIAWFTYDIPIPFGPKGLDHLPGLVLEGNIGGNYFYTYLCSKIEYLDPNNKLKYLKEPTKGKLITYKEYQDLEQFVRVR